MNHINKVRIENMMMLLYGRSYARTIILTQHIIPLHQPSHHTESYLSQLLNRNMRFAPKDVIKGWTEALMMMQEGEFSDISLFKEASLSVR